MAGYGFFQSPKRVSSSSVLNTNFVLRDCNDSEFIGMISPNSVLDSKTFNSSVSNCPKTPRSGSRTSASSGVWEKLESRGFGLALVDEKPDSDLPENPNNRKVVLGSQLKIQVPNDQSPVDFGTKTRNSFSPSPVEKSSFSLGCFTSEMELSEDYTCVISYGANPRTTHIFDDCIVESCCGVVNLSESREAKGSSSYPSDNFLSFCCYCNKSLGQGVDIYMYRGEKAFCSSECRCEEMMLEEELETREHRHVNDA